MPRLSDVWTRNPVTGRRVVSDCPRTGKFKYPDAATAQQHRDRLVASGLASGHLSIFHCRHCQHWHVGHDVKKPKT